MSSQAKLSLLAGEAIMSIKLSNLICVLNEEMRRRVVKFTTVNNGQIIQAENCPDANEK